MVNEAAETSPVKPIVNMGQGFFGYNPPQFVLDAAKESLNRVECNQYSPTKASGIHFLPSIMARFIEMNPHRVDRADLD
jgi:aspartate/methionine/tyrosine aminotransferase